MWKCNRWIYLQFINQFQYSYWSCTWYPETIRFFGGGERWGITSSECDSLSSAVQPTWFYEYTVYCIQYANTFLYVCVWLTSVFFIYLTVFIFCTFSLLQMSFYLRKNNGLKALEFPMLRLCASIFPLCTSRVKDCFPAVRIVTCLSFWMQFFPTAFSGGVKEG